MRNIQFEIIAYSKDGTLLTTEIGIIKILMPKQVLGIASFGIDLPGSLEVDKVNVAFDPPSSLKELEIQMPEDPSVYSLFPVSRVDYEDRYGFPKVTGVVSNPFPEDVTNVSLAAIYFNRTGEIIGSGWELVDRVPQGGTAAFEMSLNTMWSDDSIADFQIWTTPSILSDFVLRDAG